MATDSRTLKLAILGEVKDLSASLNQGTKEVQTFGEEAYMLNEEMDKYMKMSKTEQIAATRENSQKLANIQKELEGATDKRKQRMQEQEIERKVQERLNELGKQQQNQTT